MSKFIPVSGPITSTNPAIDSLDNIRTSGVPRYYSALEEGDVIIVVTPGRETFHYRVESASPRPPEHFPDIIYPKYSTGTSPYVGNLYFILASVSGSIGTSGTSGTSGFSGTSGTSGIDGTSGTSGISGIDGTSGTSGIDGIDGSSGTSGIDGTSGSSGSSGTSGIDGTSGISGTSGTSGISGIDGTSGTSGVDGTSGTSGTSGTGGGAGDGTIPLGYLPSGQFYDGLVALTEIDQVNESINWINEVLSLIAPARPGDLTGQTLTLSGTTRYNARVPTGLASIWYGGGISAGDIITDYVIDNTFTVTTPSPSTRFYNGMHDNPGGILSLYAGSFILDSISTISTGSSTSITVTDVSTYNSIWSKANAYASITQVTEGYESYNLRHTLAGNTNFLSIRYDDVHSTPAFLSALSITENTPVWKYLSGIQYYGQGTTLYISYTAAVGIFTKCYHPTAVAIVSQNNNAFTSFNMNPVSVPAYNDTFEVSDYTVTLNQANVASNLPTITVTLQKPTGVTATSTVNLPKNLCTWGTPSTTTRERFYDEIYRLEADTDIAWTSTKALVNGEAQVRNGSIQFPNATEYPGFSGDQEYQRKFTKESASAGYLVFSGLSSFADISAYGTGDLNVLLYLDTDALWFDLGQDVGFGGNGSTRSNAMGGRVLSGSFGVTVNWSIGTYSTGPSYSGNLGKFRLVVIFRNSVRSITDITSS